MELRIAGPSRNLRGTIRPPGDKSMTHRALPLAAMAAGPSRLQGALRAGVIDTMIGCLEALGIEIKNLNEDELLVRGRPWRSPGGSLDCRNSGTTIRLLLGALAGSEVRATLTGAERLAQRPLARVLDPLRRMGGQITGANGGDRPPLEIIGSRLHGIEFAMPVASAQVKTAILLAGLHAEGRTIIHEPVASRDHSERLLRHLGVSITMTDRSLSLEPLHAPLSPFEFSIPGDVSAAAFPLAAALLAPDSELTLRNVGLNPSRTGLLEALRAMGAQIETSPTSASEGEPAGDLTAEFSELRGIEIAGEKVVAMIDEVPILAVVATQCRGETSVRNAGELRLKESDRLSAMTIELRKMGARIEEQPDGITVQGPTPLNGAHVSSHADHRVAMALAVAGTVASGETVLSGAEVIQESYPGFSAGLRALGVKLW